MSWKNEFSSKIFKNSNSAVSRWVQKWCFWFNPIYSGWVPKNPHVPLEDPPNRYLTPILRVVPHLVAIEATNLRDIPGRSLDKTARRVSFRRTIPPWVQPGVISCLIRVREQTWVPIAISLCRWTIPSVLPGIVPGTGFILRTGSFERERLLRVEQFLFPLPALRQLLRRNRGTQS